MTSLDPHRSPSRVIDPEDADFDKSTTSQLAVGLAARGSCLHVLTTLETGTLQHACDQIAAWFWLDVEGSFGAGHII